METVAETLPASRHPTFRAFVTGAPAYVPVEGQMAAWLAVLLTTAIMISAQLIAFALNSVYKIATTPKVPDLPALPAPNGDVTYALSWPMPPPAELLRMTLLSQIAVVVMTLVAARRTGLVPALRLARPAGGWRPFAYAVLAMLPVLAVINLFSFLVAPADMARDFSAFAELARADVIVLASLTIGAGASASEELMFRGFLLSSLAATRLGYWPAAVLATLAWTALHWTYSWVGLLEVFVIGLYFSWLLWRTGSLWPPLVCHALYNSCLLAILRFWPA